MGLKSKHESTDGKGAPKGGTSARKEGGFTEGEHGRGPTPYKKSHSAAPGTLSQHSATSGRGAGGMYGGAEQNKTHAADVEHPQSHSAFEELGRG